MLATFTGVVQNRKRTTDNNDCSAKRDQCRLHFVASQSEAPTAPRLEVNAGRNERWMNAQTAHPGPGE
jgi:hypothetical protein